MTITGFRKFMISSQKSNLNSFVTQYPFRGHDNGKVQDLPLNHHKALKSTEDTVVNHAHRHPDITDEMIRQNPWVFKMQ